MSRTRCWILSERVLCTDLVTRALGLYVEEGRIRALVPLADARELAAAGLAADGSAPSWRPSELPRPPSSNPRPHGSEGGQGAPDDRGRVSESRYASLPVHDFGQRPVVPAFVNGHTHLGMAPLRGITSRAARAGDVVKDVFFRVEEYLTASDVRAFTRVAAFECLLAGVAEVWDHYYYGHSVAQALLDVGLTGTVAPTLQDLAGPGSDRAEDELEATHVIASNPRLRAFGIDAALGIHASDTASDELLSRAGDLARSLGLPVHLHLLQSQAEFELTRSRQASGVSTVLERLDGAPLVVAHALFASRADVAALCKRGATLAFCPLSQAQFGFVGPIEDWLEAGGGFALGTDSVASNDTLDVQRELALTANLAGFVAAHGAERQRFFEAGDDASARALEARRQHLVSASRLLEPSSVLLAAWGAHLPGGPRGIQPGAPANLLVLDPEHPALFPAEDLPRLLVHAAVAPAIHQLLVHGQALGEPGNFSRSLLGKDEYKSALGEALARREELYARAGI